MASAWGNSWGLAWGDSWGTAEPQLEYVRAGWDVCARCWTEYPEHRLLREWTGLRVCRHCFDHRHPQDFVRAVPDRQGVRPGMRPEPEPYFLATNEVQPTDL